MNSDLKGLARRETTATAAMPEPPPQDLDEVRRLYVVLGELLEATTHDDP